MNRQGDPTGTGYERDRFMTFFVEKMYRGELLQATRNYLPFYNK
jgi:hypothetical protein